MYRLKIMLLSFSLLTCFNLCAFSQQGLKREHIFVNGIQRDFVVYVPSNAAKDDKMPLVISLHGGFASPKGQFHLADFRPLADTAHFIVIAPASKYFFHDAASDSPINDVKFIDEVINYAVKNINADPQRIYVAGISNGGLLASRLACQLSNRIAAVAVVAASMDIGEGYAPEKPMPVIYMHCSADKIFPGAGGKKFGRTVYSQDAIIKKWIEVDKCSLKPLITNFPDTAHDGTSIEKYEYVNRRTGNKVIWYNIINGGHTWPGGWQYLPQFIVGKTTHNMNACEEIWDFFKLYKLAR